MKNKLIVKNNLIPFKGYSAMSIFPFIFIRKDWLESISKRLSPNLASVAYDKTMNHERIHFVQQAEMIGVGCILASLIGLVFGFSLWLLLIPLLLFYVVYAGSYLKEFIQCRDSSKAYHWIWFEREAYANEGNFEYLNSRKIFSWIKYIRR